MKSQRDANELLKKFAAFVQTNNNPKFIIFPYNPQVDPMVMMNNHVNMLYYNQYGITPPINQLTNQMSNMNLYSKYILLI
jgi:hypothetical protein